jgi:hypothetical protein
VRSSRKTIPGAANARLALSCDAAKRQGVRNAG